MRNPALFLVLCMILWSCTPKSDNKNSSEEHGHSHADGSEDVHADASSLDKESVEFKDPFIVQASENSPEFIQHASGVKIIENIADFETKVGIETQEGYFGPLLFGGELRTFFIVLHPGQFLAEHAHAIESIVYTVSGKWVLCSEGNRQVMKPGTLFHFGDNKPTGWEAPFNEEAHLLVVKKRTPDQNYESYMAGLADMAAMMDKEMEKGMTLWYHQLGPEHPARQFAAQVNPDFDQLIDKLESR